MKGAAFPVTLVSVVSFVLTSLSEIVNMNNDITEKPTAASELEVEAQPSSTGGPVYDVDLKVDYDRTGAIDAERIEHDMTVLQAVKAYPAASLWAVVMSSTIVSSCP
jgi:MFS transporter, SP family, general alpha glucoside:H+ symporter